MNFWRILILTLFVDVRFCEKSLKFINKNTISYILNTILVLEAKHTYNLTVVFINMSQSC